MRTTLDIDDDLLIAAKELARAEKKSAGKVVSELIRKALTGARPEEELSALENGVEEPLAKYGLRPFPKRGGPPVTNELINRLRDETNDM